MSHQRRSDLDSFFRSVYDSLAKKVLEADSAAKPKSKKHAERETNAVAPAPRLAKSRSRARSSGR